MDYNHIPGAIYLDLSKAFDTLNFDILLSKLKFYGVVSTPLKLLDNYLRNTQRPLTSIMGRGLSVDHQPSRR